MLIDDIQVNFVLDIRCRYATCCTPTQVQRWRTYCKQSSHKTVYSERQAWCYLQVKLCDPRLCALSVVATIKALYKYTSFLSFPLLVTDMSPWTTATPGQEPLSKVLCGILLQGRFIYATSENYIRCHLK